MAGGDSNKCKLTMFKIKELGPLIDFQKQLLSLSNNKNCLAKFSKIEIDLLQKFLVIRNINESGSNESRAAIIDLAKLLNVNKEKLELFFNIIFNPTLEKLIQFNKVFEITLNS